MVDAVSRQGLGGLPPAGVRDGGGVRVAPASGPSAQGVAVAAVSVKRLEAGPPPVDVARVAAIRAELAGGSYRVDAGRIAEAMIRADLERG